MQCHCNGDCCIGLCGNKTFGIEQSGTRLHVQELAIPDRTARILRRARSLAVETGWLRNRLVFDNLLENQRVTPPCAGVVLITDVLPDRGNCLVDPDFVLTKLAFLVSVALDHLWRDIPIWAIVR
ncbi:hypothetical protein JCM9803A_07930 [Rhodococcus erythropolis]